MIRVFITSMLMATFLVFSGTIIFSSPTHAATQENCSVESASFLGFPTWYKFLEPTFVDGECKLTLPRDSEGNENLTLALPRILLAVFEIILRVAGLAAVGFVIYGGIQYILSQGEPDRTKSSKNTIVNALVGLAVAMMAAVIVNLIGNSIT